MIRPRYMTAMRSHRCRTTARLCEISSSVSDSSARRSCSRFRIVACTLTSSADTGSSATSSSGAQRERAGDGDPLALPAGELTRVRVNCLVVEADEPEQLPGVRLDLVAGHDVVHLAAARAACRRRSAAGSATSTGPGRPSGSCAGRRATGGPAAACRRAGSRPGPAAGARTMPGPASTCPSPDSPTSASASPRRIVRSTPSTARRTCSSCRSRATIAEPSGKLTETSRASSSGRAGSSTRRVGSCGWGSSPVGSFGPQLVQAALEVQARGGPVRVDHAQPADR